MINSETAAAPEAPAAEASSEPAAETEAPKEEKVSRKTHVTSCNVLTYHS